MTKKERFLASLRNMSVDELVWAPNFDYWYNVNKAEGTLPDKYADKSTDDISRMIGAALWKRVPGFRCTFDHSVTHTVVREGYREQHTIKTPVGSITEVLSVADGEHRAKAVIEHYIKNISDIKVMSYYQEAVSFEEDFTKAYSALSDVGEDGIVLHQELCVPFLQFAKQDAGFINGLLLWMDYREEVERYFEILMKKCVSLLQILARSPIEVVELSDNMDSTMISPDIFKVYALPFYHEAKRILTDKKILKSHFDGKTSNILSMVPGSGLDAIEAVTTVPMTDITLSEALQKLDGKVALMGGLPSVMLCADVCSELEFESYIENVILPFRNYKGFILGMGDNVPPNADFSRVEKISGLIKS